MMNDVLKSDAAAQQVTKAKPDWRTREARATRRAKAATVPSVTCDGQPSPSACTFIEPLWVNPQVAAAADTVARSQAVRNSVARKLDGGSLAVTADDVMLAQGIVLVMPKEIGGTTLAVITLFASWYPIGVMLVLSASWPLGRIFRARAQKRRK